MAAFKITMRDGAIREFKEESRPGGSYSTQGEQKGDFFLIKDVWGKETYIPITDIKEIERTDTRGYGW